jgi:hypothetical protein
MDTSPVYLFISILVLAIIAVLMIFVIKSKPGTQLSKLTALAFAFIIAGIIFGEDRLLGYSLIAIGVILALLDIYYKMAGR